MRGNHFESVMGVTGFGESHGKAVGVLLEDVRPGVRFPLDEIQKELDKRRPGTGEFLSSRNEADRVEVLSGVVDGLTTGMPICLLVYNKDQRSGDYKVLENIFRPGHADYSWYQKFKILDWRGGGRASGRETIARVAAGGLVNDILGNIKIEVYPVQIGKVKISEIEEAFQNSLCWHERSSYEAVLNELKTAQEAGDSVGGVIEIRLKNVRAGLGEPVFGRLDAKLAEALISIGGVKGIEFGAGFAAAAMKGSEHNDQMDASGFLSNNCGGILGGVSTGEPVIMRIAVKPTSSIKISQKSIDIRGEEHFISRKGRHDTAIFLRIMPVAKAMVKLVLADFISHQKLIDGETADLGVYREAIDKIDEDILITLRKREELSRLIGKWKKKNNIKITDNTREKKLLAELAVKAKELLLDSKTIEKIWEEIINRSKKLQ